MGTRYQESKTLKGPWSKETDPVTMPPDVMPYAIDTLPKNSHHDAQVRFDVVRFHPSDGVTVPRHFDAGVGDLSANRRATGVPSPTAPARKAIRSISHSPDRPGCRRRRYSVLPAGFVGPRSNVRLATLLRADRSISVHSQSEDEANEVRKDIDATYNREIEESSKKRKLLGRRFRA